MTRTVVKAMFIDGTSVYYASLADCCEDYGIRYKENLKQLIEEAGLAPDGKTFFDYPTKQELEEIREGKITLVFDASKRKRRSDGNGEHDNP